MISEKRIAKEIKQLLAHPPPNIQLEEYEDLKNIKIKLVGAEDSLYSGEEFSLQFKFSNNYPMESPEVVFMKPIPIHPHVYSNGHICLSILYDQWSPALTISSVCLSILSMLSSAETKEKPKDDEKYVRTHVGKSPKDTQWWFHDDKV